MPFNRHFEPHGKGKKSILKSSLIFDNITNDNLTLYGLERLISKIQNSHPPNNFGGKIIKYYKIDILIEFVSIYIATNYTLHNSRVIKI